jgi:glycosyltransferase involved in cell wall biosynthesis
MHRKLLGQTIRLEQAAMRKLVNSSTARQRRTPRGNASANGGCFPSSAAIPDRPVILVLVESYLPGYKGGGPVRSISNAVEALGDELDFRIVTNNCDVGEPAPYPEVKPYEWTQVGKASVMYIPKGLRSVWMLIGVLRSTPADLIYLNSFFARKYSMLPSLLRRLRLLHSDAIILAPRGEFSAGAMQLKAWRKRAYVATSRALSLYDRIVWHASSQYEEQDIKRTFRDTESIAIAKPMSGSESSPKQPLKIVTALDMPGGVTCQSPIAPPRRSKPAGSIRLVFLSRLCRMKNLDGAISFLNNLLGKVHLTIYGPAEDVAYWKTCQTMISRLPRNVTVEYVGAVHHDSVRAVMEQNDLLLFPTLGENYGHVILEALLAGCPVVISDQTPWRNLEAIGVGWDLPLRDSIKFQDALQACIDMEPKAFAEFSLRAKNFGIEKRTDSKLLEQNRALFLDLLPDYHMETTLNV